MAANNNVQDLAICNDQRTQTSEDVTSLVQRADTGTQVSDTNMNRIKKSFSFNINNMPEELLFKIFESLNHEDKLSASLTCRHWYILCRDPLLWRNITFDNCIDEEYLPASKLTRAAFYAGADLQSIDFRRHPICTGLFPHYHREILTAIKLLPQLKSIGLPFINVPDHGKLLMKTIGRSCRDLTAMRGILTDTVNFHHARFLKSDKLKVLNITFTSLDTLPQSFVEEVPACFPNLEELYINSCAGEGIMDSTLITLAQSSVKLTKMFFIWNDPMTLNGARAIASMKSLDSLAIRFIRRVEQGIFLTSLDMDQLNERKLIDVVTGSLCLKNLILWNNIVVPEQVALAAIKNQPNLETLALLSVSINTNCLVNIGNYLPKLRSFCLGCPAPIKTPIDNLLIFLEKTSGSLKQLIFNSPVTLGALEAVRAKFPDLKLYQFQPIKLPSEIDRLWKNSV